jgi:hypothetical protein
MSALSPTRAGADVRFGSLADIAAALPNDIARCALARDGGVPTRSDFSSPMGAGPRAPRADAYVDLSYSHRPLASAPDGGTPTD